MADVRAQDHALNQDVEKQQHLIAPAPLDPHVHDNHWDVLPGNSLRGHHLRNLRIFQDLIGIRTQPHILRPELSIAEGRTLRANNTNSEGDHAPGGRPKRSLAKLLWNRDAYNGGYYMRAMDEALRARIGHDISNVVIHLIYITQILVAAIITGLAAYDGHRIPLTTLGAINTILAGLMAYLKGQGLPNRLLKSRDQFNKVMEYAEYKERQFSHYVYMLPDLRTTMDPYKEADKVRDLFEAAKKDQQDNYPDIYLNNNERAAMTKIAEQDRLGRGDAAAGKAAAKGEEAIVVTGPAAH